MKPFNYAWTDERGMNHFYPHLFGWHCDIHGQVCNPFTPLSTDDILRMAAADLRLGDDAFAVLAQAVEGREIGGQS